MQFNAPSQIRICCPALTTAVWIVADIPDIPHQLVDMEVRDSWGQCVGTECVFGVAPQIRVYP